MPQLGRRTVRDGFPPIFDDRVEAPTRSIRMVVSLPLHARIPLQFPFHDIQDFAFVDDGLGLELFATGQDGGRERLVF